MNESKETLSNSKVEFRGIDYIPEEERNSSPLNVFFVIAGAPLCFPVMLLGAAPVALGLGWWDAFFSLTIGILIGSIIVAPIAFLGTKTGTNGPVGSGVHFGVRGTVIGGILVMVVAIGFFILTIMTGAQSLVYGTNRLFNSSTGTGVLVLGALIITLFVSVFSIYGQRLIIFIQKIGVILTGIILIVSVFVFWPQFDASYQGGNYVLGGYWSTWFLSATMGLSMPLSVAIFLNDYNRYVSSRTSSRSVFLGNWLGMVVGVFLSVITAAYLMTTLKSMEIPFVQGIFEQSPYWFIFGLLIIGLYGSLAQGVFCLYGAGLGLQTLGVKLSRIKTTLITSIIGLLLVLITIFIYDISDVVNAFVIMLTVGISPWLAINLIGYYLLDGKYLPLDLHRSRKGIYWYSNGFNIPAVFSWCVSVVVGLLFTSSEIFNGPLTYLTKGVDISFISSGIVGGLLYYLLFKKKSSEVKIAVESRKAVGKN